jgi:hypothetical protein
MSGVIVLKKKCPFCEVVKMCNGLHHCVPLVKMVKKTYMELPIWGPDERVMPPRKCSVIGTSGPHLSRNFRHKLELPARIRAGTPGSSLNFQHAPEPKLPARAGTSGKPNKKGCSGLTFWIPIRTVLNLWKTWKIRLGEVFYWDKTTPLYIYERIMAD